MAMPDILIDSIALFFAGLFALAAYHKFRSPGHFSSIMGQSLYGIPRRMPISDHAAVYLLALIETVVAIAMLLPASRTLAMAAVIILLLIYALFIGLQVRQGKQALDCGCAGPSSGILMSTHLVWRNLICAGLAGLALLPTQAVESTPAAVAAAVCMAAFLVATYHCSNQLIANAQKISTQRLAAARP